jgi:hypothetical protein
VDVRIGVTNVTRELSIELPDDTDVDALRDDIETALMGEGVLWLTDKTGGRTGVPVTKVAYVEVGAPVRSIGFAPS